MSFTDALYPLSASLDEYAGRTFYVVDWGIYENLNLLHQGRLDFRIALEPLSVDTPHPEQLGEIRDDAARSRRPGPGPTFANTRYFPMWAHGWSRAAESLGYRPEVVRTILDSNSRPMFEIVRFVAARDSCDASTECSILSQARVQALQNNQRHNL